MLDNLQILKDLSEEEKEQLSMFCQERFLGTNEILFCEGDDAASMYILKEGRLEVSKKGSEGEVVLGEVEAEEVIGEMAIFGGGNIRMATAKAVEDSLLITLLDFSIQEMTNKHPELMEKIKDIIELRNMKNKTSL